MIAHLPYKYGISVLNLSIQRMMCPMQRIILFHRILSLQTDRQAACLRHIDIVLPQSLRDKEPFAICVIFHLIQISICHPSVRGMNADLPHILHRFEKFRMAEPDHFALCREFSHFLGRFRIHILGRRSHKHYLTACLTESLQPLQRAAPHSQASRHQYGVIDHLTYLESVSHLSMV